MASGAHSHEDCYTKAQIDQLLAGYVRLPEPEPEGTWLFSDDYSSWQHAIEDLYTWQQNGHQMAGLLVVSDDVVRNYPIYVPPLVECVIEGVEGQLVTSRSTNPDGSTFRGWLTEDVTVRRLQSWGPMSDFPVNDDDSNGLSDSCGFKTDGCIRMIFEDCVSRNHKCAGVWFTANDSYSGMPGVERPSDGCQWVRGRSMHTRKDGYHASHGARNCASIDSISQSTADDGHACSAEWGNRGGLYVPVNNTIIRCRSLDLARASCFTVEGQTGWRGRELVGRIDRPNTTALLRMGTNDSYPGVGLVDARLTGFDFTVLEQSGVHAVINLTAGAGPVEDVILEQGQIRVGQSGSSPVIRIWEYAGFGTVRRVTLRDIHVTGPSDLVFLDTNVPGEVTLEGCTLNGQPVMGS